MIDFLHPFKISVGRAAYSSTPSEGLSQSITAVIASTSASIQLKRDKGFGSPTGFPAPTNTSAPMPAWMVYVPLTLSIAALGMGAIQDGDIITDLKDSRQFKVDAAEYTPLEWLLACTPYKPDA